MSTKPKGSSASPTRRPASWTKRSATKVATALVRFGQVAAALVALLKK